MPGAGKCQRAQADPDLDGFGTACDADYDQSGVVASGDFSLLRVRLGRVAGEPGFDPLFDHDGDGALGSSDVSALRLQMGRPPGPSGLSCAGSAPCSAP